MTHTLKRLIGCVVVVAMVVVMAGCAAGRAYRRGDTASRAGDWDTAVAQYRRAVQASPRKPEYQIALERAMITASLYHVDQARIAEARGQLEEALREYRRASDFDPPNRQIAAKVLEVERRMRDQAEAARPTTGIRALREQARQAGPAPLISLNEVLGPIRFTNTNLRDILSSIGQGAGINVTYDSQFPERPYTVELEGLTLGEVLNQIMTANTLFYKVVNQRTILVIPDTPAKRAQYEELVLRTFYLSHTDVADIVQILNTVARVGATQLQPAIAPNKTANAITVRATEAMMAIIERLIEANDRPRAEVIVDVQILEVNRNRMKNFGIDLGSYAISTVFSPEAPPPGADGGELGTRAFNANSVSRGINTADFYLAVPAAIVRFLETDIETKIVAKPQLRGSEGADLQLELGEDIPVPTTSFAPIAQGGAAVNPLVSFDYRSVGINVRMTPRVTYEGDIRMTLFVESSQLGAGIDIGGQKLPSFGTRNVTTSLRLREGESTLLAGLLREDQRTVLRGFPWLLRLPGLKQLFSSTESNAQQTDIIMLLTPRIVRTHELTAQDLAPIYIGTSTNLGLSTPPPLIGPPGPPDAAGALPGDPAAPPPALPVPQGQAAPAPPQAAPAATSPAPGPPVGGQLLLSVPATEFRVGGGPYTVPVSITNANQLSSVSLTITYNPAVVRVRTVQEGSFMRSGGAAATFTQQSDPSAGRVDVAIVRTGDITGVAGTGMLAGLLFEAIGAGPANLSLTGTASGPNGARIALQFPGAPQVTVR